MAIVIRQLYYNQETRQNCFFGDSRVRPVKVGYSPYFENQIVAVGAPENVEYYGVWSHQAIRKIQMAGNRDFSFPQLFAKNEQIKKWDVVGFHHRVKNMLIFSGQQREILDYCYNALCERIGLPPISKIGRARFPVMQNHFLAKKDVFNSYAKLLRIAISEINSKSIPEIWHTVNYTQAKQGIEYSYIPFVLEKLFSTWLQSQRDVRCCYFNNL